ncbi:XkdW family protein [Pseudomonas solani]|uniref:XkdW family protein n=1 Tax=Pseudomonas solani TaxID=2731552 RepID=UPI003D6AE2F1
MTIDIHAAVLWLAPNAVPGVDFRVQDDGDGPYIADWRMQAPPPSTAELAAAAQAAQLPLLCAQIDSAADAARRAVSGDPLRAVEYEKSAAEAQAFKEAGYPADAVPRTVAAWAINGRTAQQAADSILAEAAAYTEALYQIRETRLQAKELIRQAMANGNVEQAQDIAAETIAAIEAAVAGIGNNA